MATFHLDLVTPDKLLFSGAVEQVDVPGAEGDFGVLAGHAPLVAMLKPGVLVVHEGGKQHRLVVIGGFAEVSSEGLTILADFAGPVESFDRAVIASQIAETEQRIKELEQGSLLDREIMRLDQFKTLDSHLQTTALH
ncbi:MAG TPA: F0F1 ATP synthase subunit epsilon [Xanthobacteraceae bacterium]|nr:F0F1 ATP synthase subunit epsilon [Xanthobacteraceae bacterium]